MSNILHKNDRFAIITKHDGTLLSLGNGQFIYDAVGEKVTDVKVLDNNGAVTEHKQYLYGNNQTIIIDKDVNMTLKMFDQDGNLIK